MIKVSLRTLVAHKRRLVGTGVAVLLGVAFLAGTLVLGDSLRAGFDDTFTRANAGTDAIVRGETTFDAADQAPRRPLPASLVDELAGLPEVALAVPSIEGIGQLAGADGEPVGGNGPPTLARNWIDVAAVNPYQIAEGRAPAASGEVVVDRGSATAGKMAVDDTTVVRVPEPVPVTVVGIATFGTGDSMGAGATFFTLEDARRHLLGGADQVSSILLVGAGGARPDAVVDAVAPRLGEGHEVLTGAALTAEQVTGIGADFLNFLETFLLGFTGIALVVATFSVYNTFSVVMAQRSREAALLRALGASRAQVLGAVGLEAAVLGAVSSALGVAAGIGLAAGLARLARAAGSGLPASELVLTADAIALSVAGGLVVTVVASLAPARRASRVAPLAAVREAAVDRSATSRLRPVIGTATGAAGVALVAVPAVAGERALPLVGLGAVLSLGALVVLGPLAARGAAAALGGPLPALRGVTANLARRNAGRDPKRTASTASALMIGVAVVTLFTVFAASLKATVGDSVGRSLTADLVITADGFSGAGLAPEVAAEVAAVPGVQAAAGLGYGTARIGGQQGDLSVADPARLAGVLDLDVSAGSLLDLRPGELAISRDAAEERGWSVGTPVGIEFPDGTSSQLNVGAVYDAADIVGPYLIPAATWRPHAVQSADNGVYVTTDRGAALAEVRAAVEETVAAYGRPPVHDRAAYLGSVAGEIDRLLTVVYILLALSIIIALIGIANTLSLAIHERSRELGLLRAVGQTRRQLRAMVRWESVLIAAFGTLGGLALGLFLSWGLVRVATAEAGFGTFSVPAVPLAVVLALGTAAGVLAAVRPARQAARLDVLAAVAAD